MVVRVGQQAFHGRLTKTAFRITSGLRVYQLPDDQPAGARFQSGYWTRRLRYHRDKARGTNLAEAAAGSSVRQKHPRFCTPCDGTQICIGIGYHGPDCHDCILALRVSGLHSE